MTTAAIIDVDDIIMKELPKGTLFKIMPFEVTVNLMVDVITSTFLDILI